MKLSKETLNVLKNFSTINQSIVFKEGNTISTLSNGKNVLATFTAPETFDSTYGIYDLTTFLNTVALFDDANLEWNVKNVNISDGNSECSYAVTDQELILQPPVTNIDLDADFTFTLSVEQFNQVMKGLSTLSLPEVCITSQNGMLVIQGTDSKQDGGNSYSVVMDEMPKTDLKDFKVYLSTENLKFIPDTYVVSVAASGDRPMAEFKSSDVTYWVAIEQNSTVSK